MGASSISESVYVPLLLCIQMCLLLEVISLWVDERLLAFTFRLMIGCFVRVVYYFRSNCVQYSVELSQLLKVVIIQDTLVMLVTQGIFNLYVIFAVNLPSIIILALFHYRETLFEWYEKWREKKQQQTIV